MQASEQASKQIRWRSEEGPQAQGLHQVREALERGQQGGHSDAGGGGEGQEVLSGPGQRGRGERGGFVGLFVVSFVGFTCFCGGGGGGLEPFGRLNRSLCLKGFPFLVLGYPVCPGGIEPFDLFGGHLGKPNANHPFWRFPLNTHVGPHVGRFPQVKPRFCRRLKPRLQNPQVFPCVSLSLDPRVQLKHDFDHLVWRIPEKNGADIFPVGQ